MSKNKKPYVANVSTEVSGPDDEVVLDETPATVEEDTVTATPVVEEEVSQPVVEEPTVEVKVEAPVVPEVVVNEVKADPVVVIPGMTVKINPETKLTVTGQEIPEFAYRNVYKVAKVLPDRVIVKSGFYQTVVKSSDLVFLG